MQISLNKMFTGIIEATPALIKKSNSGITLERPPTFNDLTIGSSISINGVCLSVIAFDDTSMSFDVVEETWNKTNLEKIIVGEKVNAERTMQLSARIDGHIVQGHVEGTGIILRITNSSEKNNVRLTIAIPSDLQQYVVPKGSIALDGVSLTVATMENGECTVALIPHTLTMTTLGKRKEHYVMNIETDIIARHALFSHGRS